MNFSRSNLNFQKQTYRTKNVHRVTTAEVRKIKILVIKNQFELGTTSACETWNVEAKAAWDETLLKNFKKLRKIIIPSHPVRSCFEVGWSSFGWRRIDSGPVFSELPVFPVRLIKSSLSNNFFYFLIQSLLDPRALTAYQGFWPRLKNTSSSKASK